MCERKLRKAAVITAALILILFLIPVKINYNDGGTVQYKAALYTVVKWNRISDIEDENYQNTSVYLFPGSLKGIDELRRTAFICMINVWNQAIPWYAATI